MNARGERRRAEIVEAAGEILLHEGFGAVGHRAVAARANVPLGATTYYFKSREDLIAQGLRHMSEAATTRAQTIATTFLKAGDLGPRSLAEAITHIVGAPGDDEDRAPLLAFYERYVEAGRHPAYAEIVQDLNSRIVTLIGEVLRAAGLPGDEPRSRLVLALADGLFIGAIAERSPTPFRRTAEGLGAALPGLLREESRL